jgi:hypothetical protein
MIASGKSPEDFLWTSIGNRKTGRHLTREQYANLVKNWSYLARVDPKRHSTHSMRPSMTRHRIWPPASISSGTRVSEARRTIWGLISARPLIWPRELKSKGGRHNDE